MNRILNMFSLLPALCIMLSGISCKGGEENTPSAVADPVITPSTLSVAGDISTQSIEIKTTEVWVLSSDAQWVKFSPPGGNGSSDPVTVSCDQYSHGLAAVLTVHGYRFSDRFHQSITIIGLNC